MQLSKSPTYTGENFIWKSCSWPAGMVPLRGSTEKSGVARTVLGGELREGESCPRERPRWLGWSFSEAPEAEERKSPVGRKRLAGHLLPKRKSVVSPAASGREGNWDAVGVSLSPCFLH